MYVNKMNNEVYKKVLDYKLDKCKYFSLAIYTNQRKEETNKHIDIITTNSKYTKNFILNNFSEELIKEVCEFFKDNQGIYNVDEHVKEIMANPFSINSNEEEEKRRLIPLEEYNRDECVKNAIYWFVYDRITNDFICKYKDSIIKIEDEIYDEHCLEYNKDQPIYRRIYIFKLNDELKKIIKEINLCDWSYPTRLEDLCLIIDNYLWIYSITHEDEFNIYLENEEEYNYLKSIGVEFWKDHYVEEKKYKIDF